MRRLFWKLFLTYWLALILFSAAALYLSNRYLESVRAQYEAVTLREDVLSHLASAKTAAVKGVPGLETWAREIDQRELVPWLVLDANGRDVLNRETRPRVLDRLARYQRASEDARRAAAEALGKPNERPTGSMPLDRMIMLPDGTRYWLVPDYQNVDLYRLFSRPHVAALPITLALIVAGFFSFVLARYLSSPIERLRRASIAYASGNFSHRVGPELGARRDEIVDLAHSLDDMAARLDSLLSAQRTLLRDVSHEIRSPLARVQAALGLARQRSRGAEAELSRIDAEVERLNEMVGSILSFSRLNAGTDARAREEIDLVELAKIALEDARVEATPRNIALHFESPIATAPLHGDAKLIHSAIENILRNAVRHSPDGGAIEVSVNRESVAGDGEEYQVRIRDHGPGVPQDMLEPIFEAFTRLKGANSSSGVGLGLAIARKAIEAHGGSLRAENASGGGLRVIARLPIEG